ncbi:MAG: Hsp20/alpha crystallin family protein [Chitinophagales bacterium]
MTLLKVNRRPNGIPTVFDMFDEVFNRNWPANWMEDRGTFVPSVNIKETEKAFMLEFAVPGFNKNDFDVQIENDFITISGKKESTNEVNTDKYTRKEFSFGSFKRTFNLPENIDSDNIEAMYENGILHVGLPKKEVKPEIAPKRIEIK